MIKIIFVEDHALVLRLVKQILECEPDFSIIAETSCGQQAIALVREFKPEVVVLNIGLADGNGLDIVNSLFKACPHTRVIVFSLRDYPPYIDCALHKGVSKFISKLAPIDDLIQAIRYP